MSALDALTITKLEIFLLIDPDALDAHRSVDTADLGKSLIGPETHLTHPLSA